MLCRAVLTALAISCTLPRELTHAHGQATPRKVHRKDLICVLWLSGLQKEDLDVNMLRKLQRHNVNIDDKNRENLRKDCINTYSRGNNASDEKSIATDMDDRKASTLLLKSETETNTKADEIVLNNWSVMLDPHIDEKHKYVKVAKTMSRESIELLAPRAYDGETDYMKQNTDMSTQKTVEKLVIINNQPNLEKILNFWKMFTIQKGKENVLSMTEPIATSKRASIDKNMKQFYKADLERTSKEMEQLNRLVAGYFDSKSSTTQSTFISNADVSNFKKLTQELENFMNLMNKNKNLIINNQEDKKYFQNDFFNNQDTVTPNNIFLDKVTMKKPAQSIQVEAMNKKFLEVNVDNQSVRDISYQLLFNDQIKKSSAQRNESNLSPYLIPINYQANYNQPFNVISRITTNKPTINEKVSFSKDLIGMIAENVKAIILKDLHKEVTLTTSEHTSHPPASDTPATTETASMIIQTIASTPPTVAVTTHLDNKAVEATQVLKSIMDLFKEFNALKESSAIVTSTPQPNIKPDTHSYNFDNPSIIQSNSYTKQHKPKAIVSFKPNEPQNPREFRAPSNPKTMEMLYLNEYMKFPIEIKKDTEIIQTNAGEIPPLGIPVSKPLQLIHQNIIVTTAKPVVRVLHSREWVSDYYGKPNIDESRNIRNKFDRYKYSSHYRYNSTPLPGEMSYARYSYSLSQREPRISQYKSYSSQRQSNFSKYNGNFDYQETNTGPNRLYNRFHNFNPYNREYISQYGSKQLRLDSAPSKFDLLNRHSTRIPILNKPADNNHYNARYRGQNYVEDKKLAESILINKGRNDYRLGYRPRHEIGEIEKDLIEHNDRDAMTDYKRLKKPDIERFHERLERVDTSRDEKKAEIKEIEKCCDVALAARQQLALNTMKTRYDDTHFKNFLKTQQKVNDMLEKMLASKISEPRSVEVI